MEIVHDASTLFSLANVLLLLALVAIYANSFRKVQAEFTFGLLFFVGLLLVQNLIALYSYLTMFMYYAADVGGFVLAYTAIETAGLVILLWLSMR